LFLRCLRHGECRALSTSSDEGVCQLCFNRYTPPIENPKSRRAIHRRPDPASHFEARLDPSAPGIYAFFSPRRSSATSQWLSISVGVYPDDRYMDLPPRERINKIEAWLRPPESERARYRDFLLSGLPARTVIYQNKNSKYQSEFTVIAAESKSLEIIIFGETTDPSDKDWLYTEYAVKMRDSFRIEQTAKASR
jgi:hypothetical protein